MPNLVRYLASGAPQRSGAALPFQEWVQWLSYAGSQYPIFLTPTQTLKGNREEIDPDYPGLIMGAYRANSAIFACMLCRQQHFSEVRFQFRKIIDGRPANLFGNADLGILEHPWEGGTTGDLLAKMITDVDLCGNSYTFYDKAKRQLSRLRPDWTYIMLGSNRKREDWLAGDPDTTVLGYVYCPGGPNSGEAEMIFRPDQVAHFAPIPDPLASFRGMSWLTPLIREIMADQQMTTHKLAYFENGATANMVVKVPTPKREDFDLWVTKFREGHEGSLNAFKTIFLGGGADLQVLGANLEQIDFANVQAAGEIRIAAAARTPPVLVGFREGLKGSSLNEGNYNASRRQFADGVIRPLWRNACGSLQQVIPTPGDAELWYDVRDVAFLKEDMKDTAMIQQSQTAAINTLITAGFEPDAIIDAITSDDLTRLSGQHTGQQSVQLLPGTNGNGNGSSKGTLAPAQAQSP